MVQSWNEFCNTLMLCVTVWVMVLPWNHMPCSSCWLYSRERNVPIFILYHLEFTVKIMSWQLQKIQHCTRQLQNLVVVCHWAVMDLDQTMTWNFACLQSYISENSMLKVHVQICHEVYEIATKPWPCFLVIGAQFLSTCSLYLEFKNPCEEFCGDFP